MGSKLKRISIDSWRRVNVVKIETVEALGTRNSIILSGWIPCYLFKANHFVLVISHDTIGKQ